MGRKKIEIKYISNQKERAICFHKRKVGLLKKAAELSILCGTQVSIVFAGLDSTVHTYSSSPEISWTLSKSLLEKLGNCPFYVDYSNIDYPFDKITMAAKDKTSALGDSLGAKEISSLLKKRGLSDFPQAFLDDGRAISTPGACSPGPGDDACVAKRLKIAKSLQGSRSIEESDELSKQQKYQYFQKKINSYIRKRKMSETELITLATLKSLVQINRDQRNPVRKVPNCQILEMVSALRFKQSKFRRLVQDIEAINNNWLDYILSSEGSDTHKNQNNKRIFKSLDLKPRRKKLNHTTTRLFNYVVKSNLSQFCLLNSSLTRKGDFGDRIIDIEESVSGASSELSSDLEEIFSPKKQTQKASIIERIIQTGIFCLCLGCGCYSEKELPGGNRGHEIRIPHKKRDVCPKRSVHKQSNIQGKAMAVEGTKQASVKAIGERSLAVSDMKSFYSLGRQVEKQKIQENSLSDCQQRDGARDAIYRFEAQENPSGSLDDRQRRTQGRVSFTKQFGASFSDVSDHRDNLDDGLDIISDSSYSHSSRRLDQSIQMLRNVEGYRSFIGKSLTDEPEYPSTEATQFDRPQNTDNQEEDVECTLEPTQKLLDEPQTRWNHFSHAPVEEVIQRMF